MKHQDKGRKFSRIRKQRKALIKSLLDSFIMREEITTTEAKAKEIKSIIDRFINKAKRMGGKDKLSISRDLGKILSRETIKKLSGDFIKKFEKRKSGYARVIKLGRRKGDSAKMAVIKFV
jgi:large subunit ribosomal protein L17